jgi:hypothetical protein
VNRRGFRKSLVSKVGPDGEPVADLTITKSGIDVGDAGIYICQAGNQQSSVEVQVYEGKPIANPIICPSTAL